MRKGKELKNAVVLTVAAALLLGGCGGSGSSEAEDTSTEVIDSYTDTVLGATISIPDGWSCRTKDSEEGFVVILDSLDSLDSEGLMLSASLTKSEGEETAQARIDSLIESGDQNYEAVDSFALGNGEFSAAAYNYTDKVILGGNGGEKDAVYYDLEAYANVTDVSGTAYEYELLINSSVLVEDYDSEDDALAAAKAQAESVIELFEAAE